MILHPSPFLEPYLSAGWWKPKYFLLTNQIYYQGCTCKLVKVCAVIGGVVYALINVVDRWHRKMQWNCSWNWSSLSWISGNDSRCLLDLWNQGNRYCLPRWLGVLYWDRYLLHEGIWVTWGLVDWEPSLILQLELVDVATRFHLDHLLFLLASWLIFWLLVSTIVAGELGS